MKEYIPKDHPRYHSLMLREKIIEGFKKGYTAPAGLIAHGRGEAFNYLLGEKTTDPAKKAIRSAAAMLLLAKEPVISVNGNTAALCPGDLVKLSKTLEAKLEINLFYRSQKRVKLIEKVLKESGAGEVYGVTPESEVPGISSERRRVSERGIFSSDVVFLALEDGDRTEALVKQKKKVIAIDLNPISRTALNADITIMDDIVRALPLLTEEVKTMREMEKEKLEKIASFNNKKNLKESLNEIKRLIDDFRL